MRENRVLVDTDVWSHLFLRRRDPSPRVVQWRKNLLGAVVLIAAQTEGELRFGGQSSNWCAKRKEAFEANLRRTPTVPVTELVIAEFASIRAACKRIGHPLHQKLHMGDAWIAATAVAYDLPLLSDDGVFSGVARLRLFTEGVDDGPAPHTH